MKSTLKGRSFCDPTDIIKNATEELKRLPQHGFQGCFQQFYSRWQKCIVVHGEYFEGNVAEIIVLFVYLRNNVISGTFRSFHVRTELNLNTRKPDTSQRTTKYVEHNIKKGQDSLVGIAATIQAE